MSRVDAPDFLRFIRQERNKRVARNSSRPILIPDSGIVPNFPPELNKAKKPQSIDGITKYAASERRRNIGAKPQGAQRFPQSVQRLGGYAKAPINRTTQGNSIRIGYIPTSQKNR